MTRSTLTPLEALDELTEDELKRFVFRLYCSQQQGFEAIPKGKVHQKSRVEVADEMIGKYGEKRAILATIAILKKMDKNDLASKLEKQKQQKRTKPDPKAVPLKKRRSASVASEKGKDALASVDIYHI